MFRLVGLSALAASLLLGGCYVGLDLEDGETGTGASASAGGTAMGPTGTAEPETSDTAAEGGTSTSGASTSTSAASEDTGTGGPITTDPSTTDAITGGPMTGDAQTSTGAEETGAADTGLPPPIDVPDNAYCVAVGDWDPAWAQLELDVLALVNQVRAKGADCHSKGVFAATGPLTMDPALRCAARKHSADMAARNFFDHTNPDGELPWDRMDKAGYGNYSNAGENIAAGSPDAQGTMNQWLGSDGHCANIMSPNFADIGVGYSTGGQYGHLWTQVFGAK